MCQEGLSQNKVRNVKAYMGISLPAHLERFLVVGLAVKNHYDDQHIRQNM
jgi:hypothetical protein